MPLPELHQQPSHSIPCHSITARINTVIWTSQVMQTPSIVVKILLEAILDFFFLKESEDPAISNAQGSNF